MNLATALAAVVIAFAVILAARIAHKKRYFGGCGGDCTSCQGACRQKKK